jgi:hypothetical protein
MQNKYQTHYGMLLATSMRIYDKGWMAYVSRGAMAEVVNRQPVIAGVLRPFQATSFAICVGHSEALGRFGLEYSVFRSHFHSVNTPNACFMSFCLQAPCQFTSLLNLRFFFRFNALRLVALFDTNPFLICDCSIIYFTPTCSEMQLGRKTRYRCIPYSYFIHLPTTSYNINGWQQRWTKCDLRSNFRNNKQKCVKFDESVFYPHSYKNITYVVERAWYNSCWPQLRAVRDCPS